MPSFAGEFDPDAYVDWEIALDKTFEYYEWSDRQKIRAASSVFVEDAILWWKYLNRHGRVPQTWKALKKLLRDEFVPKYHADYLLARLQRLNQGSRTVREYYHELKTRMLRCGLEEHAEVTENRFLSGLNQEIQDLLVHKEYNSLSHLFILACKVERQIEALFHVYLNTSTKELHPQQKH